MVFLSVDGHLLAIGTIMESYRILPIGAPIAPGMLIEAGIAAAGSMFLAATIIMLPIAMVLLLINMTIGIITRSAPQLNLFSFGFPISLLAVFIVLSAMVYRAVGGRDVPRQQYAAAPQTFGPPGAGGIFAHVPEAGDGLSGEGCAVPEGLPLLRIKANAAGAV